MASAAKIVELGEIYEKSGKKYRKMTVESKGINVSDSNYLGVSTQKATKTVEVEFLDLVLPNAAVGNVFPGWTIVTKQTFRPDRSLAWEATNGKGRKLQNFSRNYNTKKLYLARGNDGKLHPFFSAPHFLPVNDPRAKNELLSGITSVDMPDAMLADKSYRPSSSAEFASLGFNPDEVTIADETFDQWLSVEKSVQQGASGAATGLPETPATEPATRTVTA